MQRLHAEIATIRVVESSSDGAIRVTVDATGAVLDIATGGRVGSLRPQEIGGRIMAVVARAQGRLAERVRQAAHATLGPDAPVAAPVWQQLRARYGEAPPEQRAPRDQPPRRGPAAAPYPPPQPAPAVPPAPRVAPAPDPAPRHRPPRAIDHEVWVDEPILRPANDNRRGHS
ncbi:MAG TPA: YbaB/EbfC family nucleoid-associated protein [Actinophytocola sp.]|uniref:YbaB/EbfC family nucleoid-associated protein n=1 Tax=Actinophytocola sp. TaxID=1872138 RepID=UPI002DBCC57C|nr:YbaB/EbfC family nucleoid-associated protein [Actinophytocola sp.]HEU5471219.1 YbaB/EbfC family nucleoid-associated protein [Actinophytocola sp.]